MHEILKSLPVAPLPDVTHQGHWRRRGERWVFEAQAGTPSNFQQLVPSIQVTLPRGETLRIQVRARTAHGWTRWLDGGWQGKPEGLPAKRVMKDPRGKVDIDVLILSEPAREWAIRLSVGGGAPWRWRWGLCTVTWRGAGRHRRWKTPPRLRRRVEIEVPRSSQMAEGGKHAKVSCSAFTVRMMLGALGRPITARQALSATWDPVAEIFGNWQFAMKAAWDHGQPGTLVFLRHWGQVLDCLRAGLPVGASIKFPAGKVHLPGARVEHSNGHLLVIRGLAPGGRVLTNDPAAKSLGEVPTDYPLEPFSRAWFGYSGMAYLLLPQPA